MEENNNKMEENNNKIEESNTVIIENIKEWLKIDTDVTKISNELREKKKNKKQITDNLIKIMKQNNVECFNINGGSLLYKNILSKKPLNKKLLLNTLSSYFKDNNTNIEELVKHIMENREVQEKEVIKRKIT